MFTVLAPHMRTFLKTQSTQAIFSGAPGSSGLWSMHKVYNLSNNSYCNLPSGYTAVKYPQMLDRTNIPQIMEQYDTILIDCDGVLWSTDHYTKFDSIALSIEKLRNKGKRLFFVTNNSMHAREAYITKFTNFAGFEADQKDIFAVSYVAAQYVKSVIDSNEKCYIIGNKGMDTELLNAGVDTIGFGPDEEQPSDHIEDLLSHTIHDNVGAVLVGFDHHFNYSKLFKATSYLSDQKCHYIATNDKEMAVYIGPKHKQPVTGAIVAAVSAASKRMPEVIGKPHNHLLNCIQLENPTLSLEKCLMIGDSLKTDVHFANNSGIDSAVVLTGAANMRSIENAVKNNENNFIPNFILSKFSDFAKYL